MRLFTQAATAALLLAGPALAFDAPAYDSDAVKAECSREWGTQYNMVAFCIDKHADGYAYFAAVAAQADPLFDPALQHCIDEWGIAWNMVAFCTRQQIDAVQQIGATTAGLPQDVADGILVTCGQQWRPQWNMVVFCMQQQVDGWRAINQ